MALFGILCSRGEIRWQIQELCGGKGIDATCFDETTGTQLRVELKFVLSRGSWNRNVDEIDYVVCWLNRWSDFPKPVIALRDFLRCLP